MGRLGKGERMMKLEINKIFEFKGKKYKVIESETKECDGCAFVKENCSVPELQPCFAADREDGKYVIFLEVTGDNL